jgi:ACS family tartrate transporter-like MFS transporter
MGHDTTTSVSLIEAKAIRKTKIRILPLILLLYIIAFLDRINIGFAAPTMNPELGITSHQFGLLAGIFFIGYFLVEIPSNLLLHRVGARVWLARILVTWGIVATLTAFVQSVNQLYLARFLLGLAEGGYFPGILLYLTYWFRQREQAEAIALVLIGIPITSIVGAPMSGLILDHVHWLGLGSWRWLLILEGLPAVACGVLAYYLLPSRPAEARFLSREEKDWVVAQLALEEEEKRKTYSLSSTRALMHGRVWHLACIAFTLGTVVFMMSFWLPQIVKTFSGRYSNTVVGLLVMIPNLIGLVFMIGISLSSDRKQERRWHTAIPAVAGAIACFLFGRTDSILLSLALLSLFVAGVYGAMASFWALPSEFLTGFSAASGIALVTSLGSLGGFFGPYTVGFIQHRTGSLVGGMTFAGITLILLATLVLLLPRRKAPSV